ncbi:S41 family peptidase [Streptomyces sp. JNUCC 64]
MLAFVAEDDLWIAPLPAPGAPAARAWRLTVDRTRTGPPRFSPDGTHLAYTSWRSLDPEVHLVPVGGGPARRLTYWGAPDTRVCGWAPPGEDGRHDVLVVSSQRQPFGYFGWAYRLPTDGSPGGRLPWGPVSDLAVADLDGESRTLLLTGRPPHEAASWKRYRGGATGRLWLHGERLLERLDGQVESPMFVAGRIAFLSDHEGVGNVYSCRPDGTDLRRHTDHDAFYARNAASDGERIVYQCAGGLWLVEDLSPGAVPRRLDVRLGGPRAGRRPYQVPAVRHVDGLSVDETGRASAVVVRGGLYWLTHRDGPARTLADTPGVRTRLPVLLGSGGGRVAYVTDEGGADAVEIAHLPRASGDRPPRRLATGAPGALGHVLELVSDPEGDRLAVAANDGRLLLLDTTGTTGTDGTTGEAGGTDGEPDGKADNHADADTEADREGDTEAASEAANNAARQTNGQTHDQPARQADSEPAGETTGRTTGRTTGQPTRETTGGANGQPGVTELIRSLNGPVTDLAFSPDGAWLAWSHPGIGRSLRSIKLARVTGPGAGSVIDVTQGRFEDENPVFTSDGRYLAFLSWRGFDPVYDVHTGDLSFPLGCRPYLVPLSSATPSPFALLPDGRPAAGGLDPAEETEADGSGAVTVEVEGLEMRVTPFPVAASKYSALSPVAGGGLVWLRWPISGALGETFANPADTDGRATLEHFDITKAKRVELVDHLDWFAVSGDGTRLVVMDEDELRAQPATESGDGDSTVWIDLRRVLHDVDPAAEWRGAYEEAGRIIRAYFWEPDMCGIDWSAVLDQYRPLVGAVASPDEFADLLREVLGELGTSHAYVTPARRDEGPPHYARPQGQLGADLVPRDGLWTVARILPGDSSDSKARSPLAGTGIREGAALTHVDGRPVDPVTGPFPLLAAAGGTTVELTFRPADGAGPDRRVAVVPLVDDRPLRYQHWVARRREVVRGLSGGKCGYLHIPDLGGSGWAQFNRDLRMEVSRPALIVDVRGNAGGHISELVVEKLTRTILGWDLTRDAQPVSYASNAPRGPVVALADEATSSDGDMITAAFKLLRLGPVVGQRTWGGVVGMTGRHQLGDGTVITVPMNAAWFDAYGWSVENHGVTPDLPALRTPLDWAEGRHAVLDDAVTLALDLLARQPAAAPPDYSAVPDRVRPPLPPRPPGTSAD